MPGRESENVTAQTASVRLETDESERLATLTLNRPPLNILNLATLSKLDGALAELETCSRLQVLILRGDGDRAFSAGVAVEDHTRERIAASLESFHGVLRRLAGLPAISIAAVDGHCLGGGMELAATCDFVLATRAARFGQPEVDLGCFPPAAVALYPERLGYAAALELLVTGRVLDAEQAREVGFVTWLVEDGNLDTALEARTAPILTKSAATTRALKRTIHASRRRRFEGDLARTERAYLDEILNTRDMDEGLAAFFEKRRPRWNHE